MDGFCELVIDLAKGKANAIQIWLLAGLVLSLLVLSSGNWQAALVIAVLFLLACGVFQLGC